MGPLVSVHYHGTEDRTQAILVDMIKIIGVFFNRAPIHKDRSTRGEARPSDEANQLCALQLGNPRVSIHTTTNKSSIRIVSPLVCHSDNLDIRFGISDRFREVR